MGSLLSYSGLSTKVRAMQSKLIKEVQYQEIAQMPSVTAIVSYLKKQPGFQDLWADLDENSLHRGDIERLPETLPAVARQPRRELERERMYDVR